jgi:hypothetical protein
MNTATQPQLTAEVCTKCHSEIRRVRIGKNPYYWGRKKDGTKYPRPGERKYIHAYRCKCPVQGFVIGHLPEFKT